MAQKLNYIIFDTDAGFLGIVSSSVGLLRITLPSKSEEEIRRQLGDTVNQVKWTPLLFQDLMARFRNYFAGHTATFSDELDLSADTDFQHKVWQITRLIPYGETRSYSWVAEQINKPRAVRAVGQALGKNPLPIIVPCHRVLASNGGLGGYSGGIDMKRHLLSLETAPRLMH